MAIPPSLSVTHERKTFPGYAKIVETIAFHREHCGLGDMKTETARVATILVDTREAAIRDALVAMGWTPPRDATEHDASCAWTPTGHANCTCGHFGPRNMSAFP